MNIHSVGLLFREPHTGLFARGTYGRGLISGVANKFDAVTRQYVSGSVVCWSLGLGYSGDWATYEFRQIIIPSGQAINGNSAIGKLYGLMFGLNLFF